MLLDAVLIERHPERLSRYYAALSQLDTGLVEAAVNRMARRTTDRLAAFIPLFVNERFLLDYLDTRGLLFRLNQIMRRVTLKPLPADFADALDKSRNIVEKQAAGLLPPQLLGEI
jgi:hypothetical protein